ncbi:MAG: TonB-dependent receptor plug domain-containing protein, partial [Methylomonas sp.]|nr:TonB-dependent receptor plug domain-containing protein [Methylomonas sp.]
MGDRATLTVRFRDQRRLPSPNKCLWLTTLAFACPLQAETLRLDIPSSSLERALLELSRQTGVELIYPTELVGNLNGPLLSGHYEPEQALSKLLGGSGLSFRRISERTFTLFRAVSPEDHSLPTNTLDTVVVLGNANRNTAKLAETPDSRNTAGSATGNNAPLRSIPQSVEIIDQQLLHDQQTVQLSDSLLNVSGVIPRNPQFSPVTEGTMIRGFRTEQLLDGFNQYYNAGDRESWINVERIEVLKGPSGLLYGGGVGSTASGALYLYSKQPHDRARYLAGFKGGRYDFFQPYFDINHPFNDNLWFRMTGEYTHTHGFIDVVDTQRFSLNPALTLNLGNASRLILQGKFSDWRSPEYQGLPATGTLTGNFRLPDNAFIGPADMLDSRAHTHAV